MKRFTIFVDVKIFQSYMQFCCAIWKNYSTYLMLEEYLGHKLKVYNRNTRTWCEIYSKWLASFWCLYVWYHTLFIISIVNFEQVNSSVEENLSDAWNLPSPYHSENTWHSCRINFEGKFKDFKESTISFSTICSIFQKVKQKKLTKELNPENLKYPVGRNVFKWWIKFMLR